MPTRHERVFRGDLIRAARLRAGETLLESATAIGISVSYLSTIETRRAEPTLSMAAKIARHFGQSLDVLVLPKV